MFEAIELFVRKMRRWWSRSALLVRLLGLSVSEEAQSDPGLVLIQIDGLSRNQFQKAMNSGNMPFLKALLGKQEYTLHSLYSGLPSSTPAMTAELLYGVKTAVPAFSFRDPEEKKIFRMYDPSAANVMEQRLAEEGSGLLAGGSAYCDIYSGGAEEAHFCVSKVNLESFLRTGHPLRTFLIYMLNPYSMVRAGALVVIEFFLALADCCSGVFSGRDLWREIKFIPSRVGVCVFLREMAVIGAKIDVARGLPVVHLDLIGYDEQTHRRGPSSKFAHWSLKGIDDAIKRIWLAANRSARRDYDVWIYSDHGNEETEPYCRAYGVTIEQAVNDVLDGRKAQSDRGQMVASRGVQLKRMEIFRKDHTSQADSNGRPDGKAMVAGMGPVGFIYLAERLDEDGLEQFACDLVENAHIPLVLLRKDADKVAARTPEGRFELPAEAASVFPEDHPFLDEMAADLVGLCNHPAAGDVVISGWNPHGPSLSFPMENGSHAGPGLEETHAFAMAPADAPFGLGQKGYMRPLELRRAAMELLGRAERTRSAPIYPESRRTLRVMTYNVHSCIGLDGKLSPHRIARVIARCNPDVVALQEVDVGRLRTNGMDQAHAIAKYLDMYYHFNTTVCVEEERYGDCILSRWPMKLIKAGALPCPVGKTFEPRGAICAEVEFGQACIRIINTHLGLRRGERLLQMKEVLGDDWLKPDEGTCDATILCGDFNAVPGSPVWRLCMERFRDVQDEHGAGARKTWFGHYPLARIDHVFISKELEVVDVQVPDTYLARTASDHRPLMAELQLKSESDAVNDREG